MSDKLTIVGPEPTGPNKGGAVRKVNIEALMLMAKYDEGFREKLLMFGKSFSRISTEICQDEAQFFPFEIRVVFFQKPPDSRRRAGSPEGRNNDNSVKLTGFVAD